MFKNANLFRIGEAWAMTTADMEAALKRFAFTPIGATQTVTLGWVPARGIEHGELVVQQGHHQVVRLRIETKGVPSQILDKRVNELAAEFENETGRKPGKKIRKELKETALQELLPVAFPKAQDYFVWIDAYEQRVVVDAASESRAGDVMSWLVKCLSGISIAQFATEVSPERAMTGWLMDGEPPFGFTVDRECDLRSSDAFKSTASYKRCNLDTEEIRQHIKQGKAPVKLAMTWKDRVSFLLTDTYQIKRIEFLDIALKSRESVAADDMWDADLAIATGELTGLFTDLTFTLGGLVAPDLFTPKEPQKPEPSPQARLDLKLKGTREPTHAPSDSDVLAGSTGEDPLYDQAVTLVLGNHKASISFVQRHLQIGYNRAARLLEAMEISGLVSAMDTRGNRTITTTGETA
ncbi:MAG: recombination-associated protein RdgC [Aquabacterium sp.]|uniref:recombination-associated protein RdgC n=1 Tax=Aquabacterium sp. TaxID=1872578 RepID=UPI003BB0229F